jgi:hypothetical protein
MEHRIVVDVYADWEDTPPRYRVYVDNYLLTERDFIWDNKTFIRENIFVDLNPGKHTLNIEHINNNGTIRAENVTVDGSPSSMEFVI